MSNDPNYEEMVRVQVPFKTVSSMNLSNRHILIQVNKNPIVFLKNIEEEGAFISSLKDKNKLTEGLNDSLQNSSIHKVRYSSI